MGFNKLTISCKTIIKREIKLLLIFYLLCNLISCALKPIPAKIPYIKKDSQVNIESLGKGKILVYNGAGIMHKIDDTARLNIWIDDKPLGQLKANEYVIIDLENKKHSFDILHLDVFKMKTHYEIDINDQTKVLKIRPTFFSNKLEIENKLPTNFDNYTYSSNKVNL